MKHLTVASAGANFIAEGTLAVLSRKQVLIKLTEEQRREVQEMLGKEVTYVLLRLIGDSVIFAEVSDTSEGLDECY